MATRAIEVPRELQELRARIERLRQRLKQGDAHMATDEIQAAIDLGLDGNPQAALKARLFLREWFGGKIRLEPLADGGLMAHWNQNIGALVSAVGTYGSGGVL